MNGFHFLASAVERNNTDPLGERLLQGLQMIGLGMATVFAVLIIIWGACELLHWAVHRSNQGTETPEAVPVATSAPAPAPVAANADNGELIAVITAAVAAMLNQPTTSFRVVSFRRTGESGRAWNAGHTESFLQS